MPATAALLPRRKKPKARPRAPVPPPTPEARREPTAGEVVGEVTFHPAPPQPVERSRVKFTVRQFEAIAAMGMVPNHVELVEGEIIAMPAVGNGHSVTRSDFTRILLPKWDHPRFIRSQDTHRFPSGWCPEPDLLLTLDRPVQGALVDPVPQLVIEVSYRTLATDLGDKLLRYAKENVQEYWVADLVDRVLRVFRKPIPTATVPAAAWGESFVVAPGSAVSPLCIRDLDLDPGDVLAEVGVEGE